MIIYQLKGMKFTSSKYGRIEKWRKTVKEVFFFGESTPAKTATKVRPFVVAEEDESTITYYLDEIVLV